MEKEKTLNLKDVNYINQQKQANLRGDALRHVLKMIDISNEATETDNYVVHVKCTVIVKANSRLNAISKATNLIMDVPGCEIACAGSKDVEIVQEDNDEKGIYRP